MSITSPQEVWAQSVTVSQTTVAPGAMVTTYISGTTGNPTDWLWLGPASAPDACCYSIGLNTYLNGLDMWSYASGDASTSGVVSFPAPAAAGVYQVRLYQRAATWPPQSGTPYVRLAASAPITVQTTTPTTITLSQAVAAPGVMVTAQVFNARGVGTDWLWLGPATAPDACCYNMIDISPIGLTAGFISVPAPATPGLYQVRLYQMADPWPPYAGEPYVRLAASPVLTVQAQSQQWTLTGVIYGIAGGTGTVAGAGSYTNGATGTLTVTAAPGSYLYGFQEARCANAASWLVYPVSQVTFLTMTSDVTCTASIGKAWTLTTTTTSAGGGYISPIANSAPYAEGTTVTLMATPVDGYRFVGWSGASQCTGTAPSIQITMTSDMTCVGTFASLVIWHLSLNGDPGGITNGGDMSAVPLGSPPYTYPSGTLVTVTATVTHTDVNFVQWSCSNGLVTPNATITVQMTADISCYSKFALKSDSGGGTGKTWNTYIAATAGTWLGEVHPWCGIDVKIQVPSSLPTGTTHAYAATLAPQIIKLGIAMANGRANLWVADPFGYGGDHSLPITLALNQTVRVLIACCGSAQPDANGDGPPPYDSWQEWWTADVSGFSGWKFIGSVPATTMGDRGGTARQWIDVRGAQNDPPAMPPTWFTNALLSSFEGSKTTLFGSVNPYYCNGYHNFVAFSPTYSAIDPPHNEDPYDQHFALQYYWGFMHNHQKN